MIELAAALCVAIIGWALTVRWFLGHMEQAAQNASIERADLLQRIQAPAVAVAQHAQENLPEPPKSVDLFDDRAYWQAQGVEKPVTEIELEPSLED